MSKVTDDKNVVASLHQLTRINKAFTKDHKVEIRGRVIVNREWAEQINSDWENTGKLYVIDEEATLANQIEREEQLKERKNVNQLHDSMKTLGNKIVEASGKQIAKANDDRGIVEKVVDKAKEIVTGNK